MKKLTSLLLSLVLMVSVLACGASAKTSKKVRIAGLKGPTTMGLVNLLSMEKDGTASLDYDLQLYGAADEIVPKLIKGELDMAAIPANLAATLYQKTNGGIQVMAVNTLGVLYVVEKGNTVHSFADLKGRTILSTGKGTTPEYVLRYLLKKNGLDPDKDVKIEYYSEASEVTAQMAAARKDAIAVLPQPYVTAAQMKDSELRVVLDLTKEWNKVCDTQLITGVTVVRTAYAEDHPDVVQAFLNDYEKSVNAANTDIDGTAALCEEIGVVAKAAIAKEFGLTVAYGLNTLQKDLKYGDLMDQMANNYKKITTVVDKTDLLYAINSSVVTKKNEKNANLGAFKENVDKNLTNDRATQNIAVKGYASPDGPVKFNDTLSKKRSESGKKVVAKLLKDAGLDIDAAAYGEDWDGFKELVEKSDIKDKNLILQVLSLYNSPAERETEIKNMSTVFNELKKDILPELRRSQIVNSTDLQGLTDAEIMAAYRNGGDLTVEQYLYAAQELANGAEEQVAILTAASKKFNDARVWNNLGVAQTQAGDKAAALKSFEKAAKLDSSKELSKNLLLANLANGNTAEAKKYAAAADAQAKAAMAAAEGDYKAAAKNLEGYNAAIALVQSNDLAGAKKAIAKDNSADADYLRAVIAAKEGDLKTAEAQLKSAVSKNPALAQKAAKDINLKALKK